METTLRADVEAAWAGISRQRRYRKSVVKVSENLRDAEQVLGMCGGGSDRKSGLLVCTNQRVLFVSHEKGWGKKVVVADVPYKQITSVTTSSRGSLTDLRIATAGAISLHFGTGSPQIGALSELIRDRATVGATSDDAATISVQPQSVAEQLRDLALLKDQGVLTEEEFNGQKAKLLE